MVQASQIAEIRALLVKGIKRTISHLKNNKFIQVEFLQIHAETQLAVEKCFQLLKVTKDWLGTNSFTNLFYYKGCT